MPMGMKIVCYPLRTSKMHKFFSFCKQFLTNGNVGCDARIHSNKKERTPGTSTMVDPRINCGRVSNSNWCLLAGFHKPSVRHDEMNYVRDMGVAAASGHTKSANMNTRKRSKFNLWYKFAMKILDVSPQSKLRVTKRPNRLEEHSRRRRAKPLLNSFVSLPVLPRINA